MKNSYLITFLLITSFQFGLFAQAPYHFKDNSKELNQTLMEKTKANSPGGAIAVIYRGKVILSETYGLANMTTKETLDMESQFYIASIAKTFTSAAILYLWEQDKLDLDEPASTYIPNINVLKKISIRQLLLHTSGLPDHFDSIDAEKTIVNNKDVLKFVSESKLLFEPGTDYAYSNSAYVLLSYIIEKVSKQSYSEFLKKTFFEPLKFKNTFVLDSKDMPFQNKVTGYNADNSLNDYAMMTYGAGGIYSSLNDMIKWYNAVSQGKILKKETWNLAFTPPKIENKLTYLAMGWNYEDCKPVFPDLFSVSAFGSLNGFQTYLFMVPDLDFGIVMLSNSGEMLTGPYELLELYFSAKKTD